MGEAEEPEVVGEDEEAEEPEVVGEGDDGEKPELWSFRRIQRRRPKATNAGNG